jgi:predicted nucleotidyltransferase
VHAPAWSERFGVRSLRIFGPWAQGSATPESVVDLVTEQALRQKLLQSVEADAISI